VTPAAGRPRRRRRTGAVLTAAFNAGVIGFLLAPIVIMMIVFGGLVVLTKGSAVAPFIYTLF